MGDEVIVKLVEINTVDYGSTGKIMNSIAELARRQGYEVTTCHGYQLRTPPKQQPWRVWQIGGFFSRAVHKILAQYTGMDIWSRLATKQLCKELNRIQPDIIHLHNLHGYYINYQVLFSHIKKHHIPVLWTLHDCWAFTGQCPHFILVKCDKWKNGCYDCPQYCSYPATRVDRTEKMWRAKRYWFNDVENMTIVTPSQWLASLVKESFLKEYPIKVINNGIDLSVFKPTPGSFRQVHHLEGRKVILGVAMPWNERKGLYDFTTLSKELDTSYQIVLVGLTPEQIAELPENIIGLERTGSATELAELYTMADVFVNPTYEDNYPTVNLEARACGTPVVTYRTGGSPESAGEDAVIIEPGDIVGLKESIEKTVDFRKTAEICETKLSVEACMREYLGLYARIYRKVGV